MKNALRVAVAGRENIPPTIPQTMTNRKHSRLQLAAAEEPLRQFEG